MFSPTSLVVGLYREFFNLNLVNTYLSIILTNAAFNLAFAVWILHGFFSSIPKEVEEAAHLDGCGRVRTLLRIMLPLTLPGVVTAIVFTFIAAWNEYVVALTLMLDDGEEAADRRHHVVRHGLRAALGPAVRRLDLRDHPRRDPVRVHREAPRRRPHRGVDQVERVSPATDPRAAPTAA